MRFLYPWMLLLAPVAAILAVAAFVLLNRGNDKLRLFAAPSILRRVGLVARSAEGAPRFSRIPFVQLAFLAAGLVLLAVAAARPQWGKADVHLSSEGRNLLVALDVSRSMLASDVHPNRLERAKVDILDLISELKGDRAGVLVFRGKGLMLCPLTTDYAFLRQAIDGISVDSAPRGETDIADAIAKCLEALADSPNDASAVLLISDGEDLAGRARKLAEDAGRRGIPIFTVGIGDPAGADVPSPDGKGVMKFGGHEVKSRLTESTLRDIATVSGGVYIPLATSGTAATTLGAIYRRHLTRIAARQLEEMLENRYVERYQLFLIPALVLLLAAAALSRGRPAGTRRGNGGQGVASASLVLLLLAMPLVVPAADDPVAVSALPPVAGGRDSKIIFNEAVDAYIAGDSTNAASLLLPYSANSEFPEAAELFAAAEFAKSADPELATNASKRVELLSSAAGAFRTALANNPDDERLQRNLRRATASLPQLREEARIDAALARNADAQPPQLIAKMLAEQRSIIEASMALATNESAAVRISGLESLSARQRLVNDMWVPLRPALTNPNAVTNEQLRASIAQGINAAGAAMVSAAAALDDADVSSAASPLYEAENTAFGFWFMTTEPPGLIDEGILCETNIVTSPTKSKWPAREDAQTALALSKSFSERFPEWAQRYIEQDAQRRQQEGSTNAPSFTAENVSQINELMEQLLWIQEDMCKHDKVADRTSGAGDALTYLYKIRDLLPKNDGSGSSSQQSQQQQQDQQQQNQQQEEQQQDQEQQEQKDEKEQEAKSAEESKDEPPPDVEETLRKALQREREHEADKQRQRREFPLPANSRDW